MSEEKKQIEWMPKEKSWDEFRNAGLLWWANKALHLFGWALCAEMDEGKPSQIIRVYPARVKYRGFCEEVEGKGFKNLSKYLKDNIEELEKETQL